MRDPRRIRPFLDKIAKYWETYPDLRFGQLIDNALYGTDKKDIFSIEDDDMEKILELHFWGDKK